MNVDYQLTAGIGSAIVAEKNEDGWYTTVRNGEVNRGDLVTDERRNRTFEVIGFGAPFHVAEVCIGQPEDDYCETVIIDCQEAVRNFDSYTTMVVCQAFLKPVCRLHGASPPCDVTLALASGWR